MLRTGSGANPRSAASPSSEEGTPTLPPEGKLLLHTNDGSVLLRHDVDHPTYLQRPGETIWAGDLSPDGSRILALPFQQEPTGITREPKILVLDADTGERAVVVRVGPRGDLGPALWSPDGTRIAYRLTVYPVDPARVHPGPHGDRRAHLCTLDLRTELTACFPDLRRVDGFDWAPDGQTLVVDVVGPTPLWLLDPSTGQSSVLVPPRGGWLKRAGLSGPAIFTSPSVVRVRSLRRRLGERPACRLPRRRAAGHGWAQELGVQRGPRLVASRGPVRLRSGRSPHLHRGPASRSRHERGSASHLDSGIPVPHRAGLESQRPVLAILRWRSSFKEPHRRDRRRNRTAPCHDQSRRLPDPHRLGPWDPCHVGSRWIASGRRPERSRSR